METSLTTDFVIVVLLSKLLQNYNRISKLDVVAISVNETKYGAMKRCIDILDCLLYAKSWNIIFFDAIYMLNSDFADF